MPGRQLWGCRRRCRLRPVVVALAVLLCLSYQSLTLIGRKIFPLPGASRSKLDQEVSPKSLPCTFSSDNLQTAEETKDSILKHFDDRHKRRAIVYAHPSLGRKERQLYQRILTQQGYNATMLEDTRLGAALKQEPFLGNTQLWDLLLCTHAGAHSDRNCMEKNELSQLQPHQKVNLVPEIKELLCQKEGLCLIARTFPELNIPISPSVCTGDSALAAHGVSEDGESRRGAAQPRDGSQPSSTRWAWLPPPGLEQGLVRPPDFSVLIKAYVLVTSLTPLRAFIHSTGAVWHPPNKKYFSVKLGLFFEKFFHASLAVQAFDNLKDAITKLLLAAEVFSEMASSGPNPYKRCRRCFQLLTFDIGFRDSVCPLVLEVYDHFDVPDVGEQIFQDQALKEGLLDDALSFLSSNLSADAGLLQRLKNMHRSLVTKLFPFPSPKLHALLPQLYGGAVASRNLSSVPAMHLFLSNVLEQFQIFDQEAPLPRSSLVGNQPLRHGPSFNRNAELENRIAMTKDTSCSNDRDALSHIRRIFTSPSLDLSPEFNPRIKEYYSEVPFDLLTVVIGAEPSHCECQVHLDERKGPRFAKYPLGLGINQIIILVTDEAKLPPQVVSSYRLTVYREERPSMPLFDDYMMCSFVQDCGLIIQPEESCGLQPLSTEHLMSTAQAEPKTCDTGDEKGQWIVPCLSCSDNRTCDWRAIAWQPYSCQYAVLTKPQLQRCVAGRKVLFIGDSTNRGIMYYLMERVNETLQEWHKTHDTKFYQNINDNRTFLSYSYYPQFWITVDQRPTFEKALERLIARSRPLKNTDQTILVVGGVQWLNSNHVHIIHKVLHRENLLNILVVVKSLGLGFHLPVDGIHSLSQAEVQHLWHKNTAILETAKAYGYEVVDTFSITMGRYKEFLQGKCGCHFHEVVKSSISHEHQHVKMKLSRHYNFGKYFTSENRLSWLQDYSSNRESPYHVQGPINQIYSEILLGRMCRSEKSNARV
ncbi:cadherin-like and PC-esterase domain-containing protein 1 isoform X2 [Rhinatrema bivittatum]|uniref:cadherin-like and PC-esterase domain-containing protein 1 isoform X2 n=1 Tax=Rhinatrema bivittatum TaxID=194408 RepID=UPI001129F7B8|nr:cadherin-like and PC-esterase domain-containing protein 1 isoform X2 [Rhinatrema bivittatum]